MSSNNDLIYSGRCAKCKTAGIPYGISVMKDLRVVSGGMESGHHMEIWCPKCVKRELLDKVQWQHREKVITY